MESTLKKVIGEFKNLPEKNRKKEILIFVENDPEDPTSDIPLLSCSTLANLMDHPPLISYKDYDGTKAGRQWNVKTIGNVTVLIDVRYLKEKQDKELADYSKWFDLKKKEIK